MKTTKVKKDEFISAGSEISEDLLNIFPKDYPMVIADIGACDGLSSIIYSRLFPMAKIIAFEPIRENYDEMLSNFHDYGIEKSIAYTFPFALGDIRKSVQIYKSRGQAPGVEGWNTGNKSSSLLKPTGHLLKHEWCKFEQSVMVEVYSLDKIMQSIGMRIDFAHIDVQGAEMMVLQGGRSILPGAKAIWIEVATIELYEGQPLKRDIQIWMNKHGFKCMKDTCKKRYGDMLWVR